MEACRCPDDSRKRCQDNMPPTAFVAKRTVQTGTVAMETALTKRLDGSFKGGKSLNNEVRDEESGEELWWTS